MGIPRTAISRSHTDPRLLQRKKRSKSSRTLHNPRSFRLPGVPRAAVSSIFPVSTLCASTRTINGESYMSPLPVRRVLTESVACPTSNQNVSFARGNTRLYVKCVEIRLAWQIGTTCLLVKCTTPTMGSALWLGHLDGASWVARRARHSKSRSNRHQTCPANMHSIQVDGRGEEGSRARISTGRPYPCTVLCDPSRSPPTGRTAILPPHANEST